MTENNITNKTITIHIDSQAAIKAVYKYIITNQTVKETKQAINKLSQRNKVNISWIPAHIGHAGNEIADRLAKRGAENREGLEEHFLPIPVKETYTKIETWGEKKHQTYWDNIRTCRQTKHFCPKITNKHWKVINKMNRREAMYLTQIYTGHATVQYHLHNMKIEETNICKFCEEVKEDVEHFIAHCPYFALKRKQIFNEYFITEKLSTLHPIDIMKFVNLTKRFTSFNFELN